jgi:hypothetical protein
MSTVMGLLHLGHVLLSDDMEMVHKGRSWDPKVRVCWQKGHMMEIFSPGKESPYLSLIGAVS